MSAHQPPPSLDQWTSDESVAPFRIPVKEYLATHAEIDGVAIGALIFQQNSNKLLIMQRAAHDSFPSLWETPGGKCDELDDSLLSNLTREVYEETGLITRHIGKCVAPRGDSSDYQLFGDAGGNGYRFVWRGKSAVKYTFLVTVDQYDSVKLDPNEHQDFIWATEEECAAGRSGDKSIKFTTNAQRDTILAAFKVHRD
ncbi:NUDIX domain-containing protein [Pochonia chlamydosporia 170]|uniref:NUDIX domain-containing protein n=1 Tax=Pochonia chlamydosporia 170 TaxID=1380566 RepID=A0A179FIS2_METCM|nr:NUDIX domain-containing protein [Pochonia chlamydosporia 170]OAQ65151.1 NUDIX domain-containing protein [Pochonia chlamydosporia 170]